MTYVSITRLRLRSIRFVPAFALRAIATTAQVRRAEGFVGGALLPERTLTFWTMTLWRDRAAMQAYMTGGAHRKAMPKLARWCDEASVVHWTQPGETLPDWTEADRRMRAEGRPSRVQHPSRDHAGLSFAAPRTMRGTPLQPRRR